jgi:uncharacterized protein (TIGR00369 family)
MQPTEPNSVDAEEALRRLRESVATSGFSRLLGAQPLRCWDGCAELVIPLSGQLTQHHGYVHGAVVGAAADNACSWAAASLAGDVVTANYTLHLLAPARGEQLRATGQVINKSRRLLTASAEVFAETGDDATKVATALASIAVVTR